MKIDPKSKRPWGRRARAAVVALALSVAAGPLLAADPAAPTPKPGGELVFSDVQLIYAWQRQGAGRFNIGTVLNPILDRLVYQEPGTGRIES